MKTVEVDAVTFARLQAIAKAANYFGRWNLPYLREVDEEKEIRVRALHLLAIQKALELPIKSTATSSAHSHAEVDDLTARVRKLEQLTQALAGEILVRLPEESEPPASPSVIIPPAARRIKRRIIPWNR